MDDKCFVCSKTDLLAGVCASAVGPMSFMVCLMCLEEQAEPESSFIYLYEGTGDHVAVLKTYKDGRYWTWEEWKAWRKLNPPPMFTEEIILEWVRRLESDEYQQCDASLKSRTNDGVCRFCCLGVLASLMVEQHNDALKRANIKVVVGKDYIAIKSPNPRARKGSKLTKCLTNTTFLPDEMEQALDRFFGKAGKASLAQEWRNETIGCYLISLNDDDEWTFKQIAAELRKLLKAKERNT